MTPNSETTRAVVDELYAALGRGDGKSVLALCSADISLRFLGLARLHGVPELERLFAFLGAQLRDVQFEIDHKVVDGEWAAVLWNETATTAAGEPWSNHGVDVMRVELGRITVLHENSDTRVMERHFPPYS